LPDAAKRYLMLVDPSAIASLAQGMPMWNKLGFVSASSSRTSKGMLMDSGVGPHKVWL